MPVISPNSSVKVNSFKEVFRREDRGRVESDGTVTFEVDGQENEFSVRQNIAFDELDGCESGFYSFDVESRVLLSKYDERQKYSGVAIKSSIVNASKPESEYLAQIKNNFYPEKDWTEFDPMTLHYRFFFPPLLSFKRKEEGDSRRARFGKETPSAPPFLSPSHAVSRPNSFPLPFRASATQANGVCGARTNWAINL